MHKNTKNNQKKNKTTSHVYCYSKSVSFPSLLGELIVRVWNIETNDNYILPMSQKAHTTTAKTTDERITPLSEYFTCIGYSKMNQTICAGTNVGRLYFWSRKQIPIDTLENPEDGWELGNISSISGTVKQLMWGSVHLRFPVLCINCVTAVYIMKEQSLCACFSERIWAMQTSASQIFLETENGSFTLKVELQVTDMCVNSYLFGVSSGRAVAVYEIVWREAGKFELNSSLGGKNEEKSPIDVKFLNTFNCDNDNILLYNKNVVVLSAKGVTIRSATGIILTNIPFVANEGEPIGMDVNGHFLTIFTLDGFLKIYDLSEREPKLLTPIRNLYDLCNDFGEIIQARCNCVGNKVALTLAGIDLIPDGRLYVWNMEQECLQSFDFHKYGDYVTEKGLEDVKLDKDESMVWSEEVCASRIPLAVRWDFEDARLLVCSAKKLKVCGEKIGFVKTKGTI